MRVHIVSIVAMFFTGISIAALSAWGASAAVDGGSIQRIDPSVMSVMNRLNETEVIVIFNDTISVDAMRSKLSTKDFVSANAYYNMSRWFSGYVTRAGLDILARDASVVRVYAPQPVHGRLLESVPLIGAPSVWNVMVNGTHMTGEGQTICVVDSGVDGTHPDLEGKVIAEHCFCCDAPLCLWGCCPNGQTEDENATDGHGHGTQVSGVIVGNGSIAGVAPAAKIVAVRVMNNLNVGREIDLAYGIRWCNEHRNDYNISVITISVGPETVYNNHCDAEASSIEINNATDNGIFVSVASGNTGSLWGVEVPACASGAASVGMTYDEDHGVNFSWPDPGCNNTQAPTDSIACATSRGAILDVLAPGVTIYTTNRSGTYGLYGGTSLSAPHVAGVAALLIEYAAAKWGRTLSPEETETRLKDTGKLILDVDGYSTSGGTNLTFPRLDVYAALFPIDVSSLQRQYASRDLNIFGFRITNGFNNQTRNVSWSFYNGTDTVKSSVNLSIQPKNTTLVYFANNYTDGDTYFINASATSGDLDDEETMTVWVGDIIARDLQEVGAQGKNKTYRFRIKNNMNESKVVNWTLTIQGTTEIDSGYLITLAAGEEMLVAAGYNFGAGTTGSYNVQARAFSGTLSDNTLTIVSNVP